MGAILRPRRGTKAVADSKNFVLAKGEIFFEVPSGGVGKGLGRIKMGDGSTAYKNLPYFQELDLIAATGLDSTSKSTIRTNIGAGTSNLALGSTSSTAYRGDRGTTAYNHSQATHARTDATAVAASSTNGNIKINGTETTVYTHPGSGTNPHGTTKSDVGLGNVGNFKAVSTVASQGLTNTEKSNARANIGAGTSSLALGTTSSTAYRGDYGNTAYTHSQSTHARTDATCVAASSTNGKIKINGTDTTVYTHPGSGTNPHGTTKSDVGLGNVGNFKAVSTVANQGLSNTEKSNARANIAAASAADVTQLNNDLQTRLTSNSASRSAGFFGVDAGTYTSSDENTYVMALKCANNIQHGLRCDTDGLHYDVTNTTTQSTNFSKLLPWSLYDFKNTMTGGNAYGHPNLYNGPTASGDRNDYLVIGSSFVRNDITPNQFYRSELKAYKDGLNFNYYDSAGSAVASWMLPYTRGRINTTLVFNRTGISRNFQGTTLAFILIGFCQNIGNVFMAVSIGNGTIQSKKDLLTGADWSNPALTISFSGTTLTLSSNSDGFNYVSLFGDGISDAYI